MKEKQILYMKFLLNLNKILKSKRVQKYLADLNKKVTALLQVQFMNKNLFFRKILKIEKERVFQNKIKIKTYIKLIKIILLVLGLMIQDQLSILEEQNFRKIKEIKLKKVIIQVLVVIILKISHKTKEWLRQQLVDSKMIFFQTRKRIYLDLLVMIQILI